MALYLDVLTLVKVLSVYIQQKMHDPIYFLRLIQGFTWLMTKIQFLVDNGINGITNKMSDCTNFLRRIAMNENNENLF